MAGKSSQQIQDEARKQLQQSQDFKTQLLNKYMGEPQVPMYLSPMYRAYFGSIMQVSINGLTIAFPVDGSMRTIPQTFADEITRRRMAVDSMLTKQQRMISIPEEKAPGELSLF